MGAQCHRAVRKGAAQREIHASRQVVGRPVHQPVGIRRVQRAHERAIRVGHARPDMALVDMGMAVDEARQHDPAGKVDRARRLRPLAARRKPGDTLLGHGDIDQREAVTVEGGRKAGRGRAVHPRIAEHVPSGGRDFRSGHRLAGQRGMRKDEDIGTGSPPAAERAFAIMHHRAYSQAPVHLGRSPPTV